MVNKIYEVACRIYNLMKLNGLWVLFTLCGGVVFGVVPSTIALYACIRKQIRTESDGHVFQEYKKFYFNNFRRSIVFSIVFWLLIVFLVGESALLTNLGSNGNLMLEVAVKVSRVLLILGLAMFFPVFSHFDVHGFKTVLQPVILMFICPLEIVLIGIIIFATILLYAISPFLIVFIGLSLPAYGMTLVLLRKFDDLEKRLPFSQASEVDQ